VWRGDGERSKGSEPDAIIASQETRRFAWLAQIAFGSAQARLSLRKERLLEMTIKLGWMRG